MARSTGRAARIARVSTAALVVLLVSACKPLEPTAPASSTTGSGSAASAKGDTTTGSAAAAALPPSLLGKDIEAIPTTKKVVALTFDAGGNSAGLASILSTLSAQKVPGTFFLTGAWANAYPAEVKKIVAGGHRIGNHTQTHPHLPTLSDAAVTSQLTTARTNIMKAGGTDPQPLFRFPYGDRNAHTISLVNKAGYIAVRWTVDTLGWKGTSGGASTSSVVTRVVNAAKPGEIVLMHVGSNPDDKTTLDANALPTVISRLRALGYGFVSLSELVGTSGGSGGGVILPGCDTLAWRTAPVSVAHNPTVPPVPVVTGIRPGRHPECRYDRITFDIPGATPAYEIRYVTSVTADGSGNPMTVPGGGTTFLLITFHPAQGHTDVGADTIGAPSAALGYQMLKGYAVTGDFEGHVTVALGLAGTVQVRAGELSGRVYVDVAY
jgi:peptidoglycan/xylan/chitin deacetylase (PgdA/CDA1 family)